MNAKNSSKRSMYSARERQIPLMLSFSWAIRFLNPLTDPKGGLFAANVTFEPGCRNNWHIHHADKGGGQLLICTAGEGWYQEEGKAAVSLHEGSVVMIPANVRHWHGAKKDSWFSHIAVEVPGEHCKNEWCEPVSDEEYAKL